MDRHHIEAHQKLWCARSKRANPDCALGEVEMSGRPQRGGTAHVSFLHALMAATLALVKKPNDINTHLDWTASYTPSADIGG